MVGNATLKSSVAQFILSRLKSKLYSKPADPILSTRELDVISLLAEGFAKKEIARQLDISYTTVDTYVSQIYQKLRVSNAPAAVNQAHRLGLFAEKE